MSQDHANIILEEFPQAYRLAEYIQTRYKPTSVTDWGCSTGFYLLPFQNNGVKVLGIDNDRSAEKDKAIDNWLLADLTVPQNDIEPADFSICLEVGEHIKPEYSAKLVGNICRGTKLWCLFSAALPGQTDGVTADNSLHINCQEKPFWIRLFEQQGFIVDYIETLNFISWIQSGYHMGWLPRNALLFRRLIDMQ